MSGLAQHHGSDATLAAADTERIARWLQAQAGTSRRVREAPPEDRLTRSSWFLREHRKVDAAVWKHRGVGSPANCAACHTGAEHGRFDEHALRAPPGWTRACCGPGRIEMPRRKPCKPRLLRPARPAERGGAGPETGHPGTE